MNKKLFFLLPAAMLALTGCKLGAIEEPKNSEPTTSESSSSSSSSESSSSSSSSEDSSSSSSEDSSSSSSEDSSSSSSSESSSESSSSSEDTSSSEGGGGGDTTNYGTEEHPLSVTEALAICATECPSAGGVTTQRIYCVGVAESTPALNGTYGWRNFDIHDENDSSKKLTVWNPNKTSSFPQTTKFYQNDVVVVEGFIKNYDGVLEFTNTAAQGETRTDPTMVRIEEVGRSTISVTDDTHAQVGQIAATELNGEEVTFTISVDDGYVATVKVNGTTVTATEGVYSFVVEGDMSVVLTTTESGHVAPDPLVISKLGTGAPTTTVTAKTTVVNGGITFAFMDGKKQGDALLLYYSNGTSYLYNETDVGHDIDSVVVETNSGSAAACNYAVAFSATPITSRTVGSNGYVIGAGATHEYSCDVANARYFCITVSAKNGQVLNLTINFK